VRSYTDAHRNVLRTDCCVRLGLEGHLCDGALSNRFVHCVNTDPSLLCTVQNVCLNSCLFKGTILQELFSTMPVHEEISSQYGLWKARFQPHSFSTFNSVFINLILPLHKELQGTLVCRFAFCNVQSTC
jgi:hypothetical protein